ncbi:unnamed protein product, partial [Mesorhabditis belari]|uniref:NADP-dependent oxidoreductase domain-containing protein n=1 Tax=Mesorhabditis belari TaxID=2138241 RepID=A0AAF3FR22_9BILA
MLEMFGHKKQPTVTLSNGVEMPLLGFGTWQSNDEAGKEAVKEAVRAGYRLIDTASIYENEGMIGQALQELYDEGVVKREDIFITTKLWIEKAHPDKHLAAIENALQLLGTSYVDLFLMHMPPLMHDDLAIEDVWQGIERLYDLGLTRAIGVSNCSFKQMERIRKIAKTPIHNTQNECHVYFPCHDLQAYCKLHNISLTSYATLGSANREAFQMFKWVKGNPSPLANPTVQLIAERHGKSPAQVLLRYMLERGIATIPKASTPQRIRENIDILDFHLSTEEVKKLGSLKEHIRYFVFQEFKDHPEYPFHQCGAARQAIDAMNGY